MRRHSGFGLIEVLVALLVIAVGVIGLMSLQTYTLQQAKEAEYYNRANFLAKDMFERMRANFNAVNPASGSPGYQITLNSEVSSPGRDCSNPSNRCTASQMANWDLFHWCDALRKNLGIEIDYNATPACPEIPASIVLTRNTTTRNSVTFARYGAVISVVVPRDDYNVANPSASRASTFTFQFSSEI
ncbi:type IV pilus modification protein PilV [Salinibius halmophilus]|uniref:type IV pilus modification protein PilV n=1 Tax=Salinibius halmophilus TaxID=1853216 RepID=UPI001314A9C5|nr:type IV pilus modification protein PilV [Salinibius halmophilus]